MHWGWEIRDPVSEIIAARLNSENFDSLLMSALQSCTMLFSPSYFFLQICHTFTIFRYSVGATAGLFPITPSVSCLHSTVRWGLTQSLNFLSNAILAVCGKSSYLHTTPAGIIQTPRNILAISCRFG